MKTLALIVTFLFLSLSARAATVMHDMNESASGWGFNYAKSARSGEKILFNIFVPKCQKDHPAEDCAHDQREAREMAHKKSKDVEKKALSERKKKITANPETIDADDGWPNEAD